MDRKSIIVLVISFLLLMAWYPLMQRLGYIKPPSRTNAVTGAKSPGTVSTNRSPVPELRTSPASPTLTSLAPLESVSTNKEELVIIESDLVRYTFTSHGGGLKAAELKKYPEAIACRKRDGGATNELATLNEGVPVPALSLLSDVSLQGDFHFTLTRTTQGLRAEKVLDNQLRVVKEYTLGSNYLLHAIVRFENRSGNPVPIPAHEWVIGTATPLGAQDELLMGVQWYDGAKPQRINAAWFANSTLGCIPGVPRVEYVGGQGTVTWAAVHNQFFTMAAVPKTNAPQVVARKIELPRLFETAGTNGKPTAPRHGFQTAFRYPEMLLPANQTFERSLDLFVGPKEYNVLARLGTRFNNNLDLVMEFDGFFGWFAKALLLSMNGLNAMGLSYGVAIVAITVIIKLLFWPLTTASTRSMKRMAALQPQMKALQEKYKDEPQKMNQKLMEFMKEHKVSPLGGCLPMLLQIPVFFGFYKMIQSAIELRGATFLWACDLSKPDTIWVIPGFGFPVNPLPLLMGVTMLWQARLTPPAPGMDPMQQKIMKYMPLMFMVFLYNFSAGLTLYWTVQNLLSIAQMKLTRGDEPKPATGAKAPAPKPVVPGGKPKKSS